jgi:glycosyltransferase involved in cell wall biosynthesis
VNGVRPPRILFVVNSAHFFRSHRLRLAQEARLRGCEVAVVCGERSGEDALSALGVRTLTIPLSRAGTNPRAEWRAYRALLTLYRMEQPDLVHHVTIKPVIYGTRAARTAGVRAVVNALPGMGWVFTGKSVVARMRSRAVNVLYRLALLHPNMRVVFQNRDDQEGFVAATGLPRELTCLIRGSGVDLEAFPQQPEPDAPITFVLVGRMLADKGVREFVEAAERVRVEHPDWRFRLVGDVDPGNPSSLDRAVLRDWHARGVVEWLGHRDDVAALLADCHVVCLPSYREGLPKTLLEAAATGRPAISTDVPGCREVVRDGVTGVLVPPRDSGAIADAMRRLGGDPALRARMGEAARQRAQALYSVQDVVLHTFRLYEELLSA